MSALLLQKLHDHDVAATTVLGIARSATPLRQFGTHYTC